MLNSLNSKIFFSYISLVLLVLLAVGVSFTFLLEDHIISTRSQEQLNTGKELATLARTILTEPDQDHSELLFFLDRALETRVWIVDGKGVVVKSSRPEAQLGLRASRISGEEINTLLRGEVISRPPNKIYYDVLMLSSGIPVQKGGRVIGGVFLHYPISGVQTTMRQIQYNLLYAAIFAVVITGGLSIWLSRGISRPILEMENSARALAGGDFSRKIKVTRNDELGTLGQSFNHMASRLHGTLNQLSQERDKLAHTVSSIEEGVIAVNREMKIILSNLPAIKLFRPDRIPEDYNGKNIADLVNTPAIPELLQKGLEGEEKIGELLELQEGLTVFIQVFPIRESSGRIIGTVALLHNLRNLDGLEEIQQKFFAGVSHELKTPLTAIRSYGQALLDGTANDVQTRERFLKIICDEADSLSRLINELLDYSRLKSGKINPRIEEFKLRDVVSSVIKSRKRAIQEKKIKLDLDFPDTPLIARGDPALIQIVVSNLLDNAIAFTPSGEDIIIKIRERGDKFWFTISDSGPGISLEEMPFIWDRFFRGNRNGVEAYRGWGLGLALAREVITAHGETIEARNKKGKGSVFSFSLPRK